jgi:hypothetical protein
MADLLKHVPAVGGSAKAWFHVAGDGSLTDSFGVSSADDDGTGDRGVNLSVTFSASTSYAVAFGNEDGGASTSVMNCDITSGTRGAATFDYEVYAVNSSVNRGNADEISFGSIHGDLA